MAATFLDFNRRQPVNNAEIKQILAEPIKTTCMPLRKISGRFGIRPVTRWPAIWLITLKRVVVAKEIPTTIPIFRTSEFTLPAIPNWVLGTVDMTSELFGD